MSKCWDVAPISLDRAKPYILTIHYAHRMPSVSFCYGVFSDGALAGVVTYGKPASPPLVKGVCGEEYANIVLELNRLCLGVNAPKNMASFLVAQSLKMLPKPQIIVSYADAGVGHVGYVYQASNFIYTGLSDAHKDWIDLLNLKQHSRHVARLYSLEHRIAHPSRFRQVERARKHRYIFFLGTRHEKKRMKASLRYSALPYPKGQSLRYEEEIPVGVQAEMALGV